MQEVITRTFKQAGGIIIEAHRSGESDIEPTHACLVHQAFCRNSNALTAADPGPKGSTEIPPAPSHDPAAEKTEGGESSGSGEASEGERRPRRRRLRLPGLVVLLIHWLQFTLVSFLLMASFLMPRLLLRWLGRTIFTVLYKLDRRHRIVVLQNLTAAFGESTDPAQLRRWALGTYQYFGINLFEILWLWRQSNDSLQKNIRWKNLEHMFEAASKGKGVICGTSHYGFWEVQTFAMRPFYDRLSAVMRPFDNPFLNRLTVHVRQTSSAILFEKKGALLGVMRALKQRYLAGLLIDQDGGQHGIEVPFFGKPVRMMDAVGHIAYKTGAPIVMVMPVRSRQDMNLVDIYCSEVIYPDRGLERTAAARKMIEACNAFLEKMIREYPEEYFWLHRRWKHGSPEVYARKVE